MQGAPSVAAGLFRFLDEEGVEYCALGDVRGYPVSVADGVDLIVARRTQLMLPALLKAFCDRAQLQLIDRPTLSNEASRFLLAWPNRAGRPEFLSLCLRSDYLRHGRRLWTASELLKQRALASESREQCEIYVPPAAKEFVRHLLHCIDRNELTDRDGEHLARQWRLDPEGAAREVARFWDVSREGGVILRAAVAEQWAPVRAARNALHAALAFHNVPSPASGRSELRRLWGRCMRPQGMLIACLGPEGAGKREVIDALAAHPLAPFERGQSMHLRPYVMRPRRTPDGATQTRKPRGRLGTIAKLMMFAADYWIGYWTRIRPSLVRSTLLVSDSYFDDVLVDPRRYRMHRPRACARLLAPWIPQPALWLVFDVPAHVLRERRGANDEGELDRQRSEYRRVLRGRRNVVVLDAGQPVEQVIADAERAIVAQASRRTAHRLGLPVDAIDNPTAARVLLFFCRRNIVLVSRFVRAIFNSDIQCRIPHDIHLPHPYGIAIHPLAALGRRVTVMQQATIAPRDPAEGGAPIIGDDVYIGAGARVLGDVKIGERVVIGANAVVTRDVPAGSTVVGANRIIAGRLALVATREEGSTTHRPSHAQRIPR